MHALLCRGFLLATIVSTCLANHKIIYLLATPRSLSTAMVHMMHNRGDFTVFQGPANWAFDSLTAPHRKNLFRENAPADFNAVKQQLLTAAQTTPVFAKDMVYKVKNFLDTDRQLQSNPNVQFVFLTRNPHHAIISYYKKAQSIPHNFDERMGYKAAHELYSSMQHTAANKPLLMRAEDIYTTPHATISSFCTSIGIADKPQALSWQAPGSTFTGAKEWNEIVQPDVIQHWQDNLMNSTGFTKPTSYSMDADGVPTFEEVENAEHRHACKMAYIRTMPHYTALITLMVQQLASNQFLSKSKNS